MADTLFIRVRLLHQWNLNCLEDLEDAALLMNRHLQDLVGVLATATAPLVRIGSTRRFSKGASWTRVKRVPRPRKALRRFSPTLLSRALQGKNWYTDGFDKSELTDGSRF